MYDVERDEIPFKDIKYPFLVSCGKTVTGMYSRFHEEVEIKFVNSGRLTAMIDTKTVTAEEDEIIFINPYEVHSNIYIDDEMGIYDLFMVGLDFFELAGVGGVDLRKFFFEKQLSFKNRIKNDRAAEVMKRLTRYAFVADEYDKLCVAGLLLEFFAILQQEEIQKTEIQVNDERVRFFRSIEPAVVKIRDNYYEKLSGEELAEMCNMSKYHFCRTFKRVMGVTPVQYQTECRLRIADILLQNRDLNISGIAMQTGFEDEAYFSRCYKKHRGVSPKTMRAKLSK